MQLTNLLSRAVLFATVLAAPIQDLQSRDADAIKTGMSAVQGAWSKLDDAAKVCHMPSTPWLLNRH